MSKMEREAGDKGCLLRRHEISAEYRGKMVDWMVEVLCTFKCSQQTFFLAVDIMDRYFKNTDCKLAAGDLHLVGIVSMFIASKYEDVIPLLMRTVIHKIGHDKFRVSEIQDKELQVLAALDYKIGVPTLKEYLDRYMEQMRLINDKVLYKVLLCISKMVCFSYDLVQLPSSSLAASILAFGIHNLTSSNVMQEDEQIKRVAEMGGCKVEKIWE